MNWFKGLFSGAADVSRIHPAGIALMLVSLALACLAKKIALRFRPDAPAQTKNAIKIISLIICAGGALLAILG